MIKKLALETVCLDEERPVSEAIRCIEASGGQIALVLTKEGRLLGTVTDGDVRRGLLRGIGLDAPARTIMNDRPRSMPVGVAMHELLAKLRKEGVLQMPLVDDDGRVVELVAADDLRAVAVNDNPVIIMAGGLGTRLRPITETIPKPMIEVAGRPILETIIERFRQQGFSSITLCVNYLAEIIEDHFGDGSRHGVSINYVREEKRMGTAGALSLLDSRPTLPMIVINGDILTSINFNQLLAFHAENNALATMGLNRFQYQVPYGVVEVKDHHIVNFSEKPSFDFFVNAGIYIIDPSLLDSLPRDKFFDMPSLFESVPVERRAAFPIHEYWLDIGRHDDLERAMQENSDKAG